MTKISEDNIDQEESEYSPEYFEFIKSSVQDKTYFKDAMTWYFFRYVNPFCERTVLVFAAILALVVLFFLSQMIQSAFPLVEKIPIIIPSGDQSRYFPNLVPLKSKKDTEVQTVDEAVLKYLLSVYINDREGFDYSKSEVMDLNNKFNRLKNTSSDNEYRQFQFFMSKDNPTSPIHQFGKDVVKKIKIESVKFPRVEPKDFAEKAREFLNPKIPTEVEIRFSTQTIEHDIDGLLVGDLKEKFVVKIKFAFSGIVKEKNKAPLDFMVNEYKLYKVQQ